MTSATALAIAARTLKAAGLPATADASAVLAVALLHADGPEEVIAGAILPHVQAAHADLKRALLPALAANPLAVAILAAPHIAAMYPPPSSAPKAAPGKRRLPPV